MSLTDENELYTVLFSELVYCTGNAPEVTQSVIETLKKMSLLIVDGEVLQVSTYVLGDEKATVWFPDSEIEDELYYDYYPEGYSEEEYV